MQMRIFFGDFCLLLGGHVMTTFMESSSLIIPCLEDLSVIEQRCRQLGLSINHTDDDIDMASTIGRLDETGEDHKGAGRLILPECYSEEYEVYAIRDYKFENGIGWYLIQWRGWPPETNTWEPKENLTHCLAKLQKFDLERQKRLQTSMPINGKLDRKRQLEVDQNALKKSKKVCETKATTNGALKRRRVPPKLKYSRLRQLICAAKMTMKKKELKIRLKAWQAEINRVSGEEAPIVVINDVDLEGPPSNFVYINDYVAGEGIVIPDDPLVGCECASSCYECKDTQCCGHLSGGEFAYNRWRRVKIARGLPIYECNNRCKCGDDCVNRVVQRGRKIKLAIFRTSNGCGWGVRTLQAIKKDSFVTEYMGEVITNEEAEKRGKVYDAQGRTYLFDLDFNDGDCPFTVDAAQHGNVSHFMNHSCDPNLVVYSVWINTLDPLLPRIAFFTKRDVAKGEELTFDYMMSGATSPTTTKEHSAESAHPPSAMNNGSLKRIRCKCGSKSCRKYLF